MAGTMSTAMAKVKGLNPQQLKFATLYAKTGNATQAYIDAGYSSVNAAANASTLLRTNQKVIAEVSRLQELWQETAGIDRVEYLQRLDCAFKADPRGFFDKGGGIRHPDDWPEECLLIFKGYSAGTATAAEKIMLESRLDLAFKLLEETRPAHLRKPATQVNLQVNFNAVVDRLRSRGEVIDVTPITST